MDGPSKGRAWFKFLFWTVVSVAIFTYASHTYTSGQMIRWYYYTAATDGYAINANTFMGATKENPAVLQIGELSRISGLQAVPVKKGQRLPDNTNGILSTEEIRSGKRVALEVKPSRSWCPGRSWSRRGSSSKTPSAQGHHDIPLGGGLERRPGSRSRPRSGPDGRGFHGCRGHEALEDRPPRRPLIWWTKCTEEDRGMFEFAIAGVEVPFFLLILVGLTVGMVGGFIGVGGGYMVTPALIVFGFPGYMASGIDMTTSRARG